MTQLGGSADSIEIVINGKSYTVPVNKYIVIDSAGIDEGGDFKYFEAE